MWQCRLSEIAARAVSADLLRTSDNKRRIAYRRARPRAARIEALGMSYNGLAGSAPMGRPMRGSSEPASDWTSAAD
jgi:hypothetical protein